jgi:hypothetical protein
MIIETLKSLFTRDLQRLKNEIELYKEERNIWRIEKDIANSAGNLCLHLIGNLRTYIGKEIGKTDYVRNRELEFSARDIPKDELLRTIEETILIVNRALDKVTPEELLKDFPILVLEKPISMEFLLIHLATHLSYHLGQINYHRRILDQDYE